ncbi:hypothetical protein GGR54DRAFT_643013 [Hypoxylon sp. NC1633]|nr:hypothetical protein GGR54DRAFT_643013 [Hypoxylon sp. NC1633]
MQPNIVSILALAAVAVALPVQEASCPRIKCFDAVSECGIKYGRCFDMCSQDMPPPPPCPTTITSEIPTTITELPTTITSPSTTITEFPTTITEIPTTITEFPTTITGGPSSVTSACTSTGTACVDILKTCGSPATAILTYGGCFPVCGPSPTFTPPPCPTASTTDAKATP